MMISPDMADSMLIDFLGVNEKAGIASKLLNSAWHDYESISVVFSDIVNYINANIYEEVIKGMCVYMMVKLAVLIGIKGSIPAVQTAAGVILGTIIWKAIELSSDPIYITMTVGFLQIANLVILIFIPDPASPKIWKKNVTSFIITYIIEVIFMVFYSMAGTIFILFLSCLYMLFTDGAAESKAAGIFLAAAFVAIILLLIYGLEQLKKVICNLIAGI